MLSDLDVYLIGKDNAKMLGVDINKVQDDCIKIISVLVSIATVLVGPITLLGLFVVNIVYIIYVLIRGIKKIRLISRNKANNREEKILWH